MLRYSRSSSQSGPLDETMSPTMVNEPLSAPVIAAGLTISDTIWATALPFLVTVTGSPVAATSSSTASNFALHSDAFMTLVMATSPW